MGAAAQQKTQKAEKSQMKDSTRSRQNFQSTTDTGDQENRYLAQVRAEIE